MRAIRERRARLAALRRSVSESAISAGESVPGTGGNPVRKTSTPGQQLGSSSLVTIDTSSNSPNVLDSSAFSFPILDIHTGNKGLSKKTGTNNNLRGSGQGSANPANKTKLNLTTELSNFD